MALWHIDIEKMLLGEYWTNRYIIEAASLAAAQAVGEEIYAVERIVHHEIVLFTKVRTSDGLPLTDVYHVEQKNALGTRGTTGDWLPLFNVVRVDFNVTGGGRPSRKYLRLPLKEDDVLNGDLTSTFIAYMVAQYVTGMLAITEYVDVDGQP